MRTLPGLFLLFICAAAAAQYDDVTIRTTHVNGAIYMLEGAGGNLAVSVGEDGVVLVDDQYAPLSDKIRAAIGELSKEPVSFVINTHWHGDHVGGNESLGASGSVIVAHDNVRERMNQENYMPRFDRTIPAAPAVALPVVTFNDQAAIHFNGEAVTAYHTPHAHTDGDSIIHFPGSNVIHMGDNFFNAMYPFVDRDSGGSVQGMIAAVQLGLGLCTSGTQVIPGHGALSNCAGLESYGQMLADATARIQALIDQGMTLEQVKKARPNADIDEKLGQGFIDPDSFVEFIYKSLLEDGS